MSTKPFYRTLILGFALLISDAGTAQNLPLRPHIVNFTPKQYESNPFILCAAQDRYSRIYFGTAGEILIYDGSRWDKVLTGSGNYIMSIAIDTNRGIVYAGGSGDFGYLTPAGKGDTIPYGTLRYQSLLELLPEEKRNFDNVWNTHIIPGTGEVFFNAWTHLFNVKTHDRAETHSSAETHGSVSLHGYAISLIAPDSVLLAIGDTAGKTEREKRFFMSYLIDDKLYIQHPGIGLLRYVQGKFEILKNTYDLANKYGIHGILPLAEPKDKSAIPDLLLVTRSSGFYLWSDEEITFIQPSVHTIWSKEAISLNAALNTLRNARIIIVGTENQGLYAFDAHQSATGGKSPEEDTPKSPEGDLNAPPSGVRGLKGGLNTPPSGDLISPPSGGWGVLTPVLHLNKESGLSDNLIWFTFPLKGNGSEAGRQLYLCTDNGISRVQYPSPIYLYGQKEGIEGGITAISIYEGQLYLATSQGVYYSSAGEGGRIEKAEGIDKQCFNFCMSPVAGNLIVAGGNDGIFMLVAQTAKESGNQAVKQIAKHNSYGIAQSGSRIYSGGRKGLFMVEAPVTPAKGGKVLWTETLLVGEKEIREISSIVVRPFPAQRDVASQHLHSQPADELWIGTVYDGVFRVLVDRAGKVLRKEHYTNEQGVPEGNTTCYPYTTPYLSKNGAGNKTEVMICTEKGLYEVVEKQNETKTTKEGNREDELEYKIVPCTRFGELFTQWQIFIFSQGKSGAITGKDGVNPDKDGVNPDKDGASREVWMYGGGRIFHCTSLNDSYWDIDTIPFLGIDIGGINSVYPADDGVVWFGGDDGLVRYDTKRELNYKAEYYCLLNRVSVPVYKEAAAGAIAEDSILYKHPIAGAMLFREGEYGTVLPYEINNIKFQFTATFYEKEEKTEFSYQLAGYDKEWSAWSADMNKEYTNLPEGEYIFRVKARNIYEHESIIAEYPFKIEPPFYKTLWFYVMQIGSYGLLLWAVVLLKRRGQLWATRAAYIISLLIIVLSFEYIQNTVEDKVSGYVSLGFWLRITLNVAVGLVLAPVEFLMNKFTRVKDELLSRAERMKAFLDGKKEGKEEGKEEREKEIIERMREKGFSEEEIKRVL